MDEFPTEPWVVCFIKDGKKILRKFWAAGYYNAFDKILSHAEKRGVDILWFKEKRYCHMYKEVKELEAFCIYCNSIFDEDNSIPCNLCKAVVCSKECYNAHNRFKHIDYPKKIGSSKLFPAS